jgi:hypothetical protein
MSEIKSMAELEDGYKRHVAELNRVCRIERGQIIFQTGGGGEYEIALSSCATYEKIVWWTFHLSEKKWMTVPVLRHFIRLACSHHGLQEDGKR